MSVQAPGRDGGVGHVQAPDKPVRPDFAAILPNSWGVQKPEFPTNQVNQSEGASFLVAVPSALASTHLVVSRPLGFMWWLVAAVTAIQQRRIVVS